MRLASNSWGFTILLGSLAALPPLAIDMGLPALPLIERSLDASPALAGQTLSLFLAGFAAAQLLLGPLSDRIGRRPVLLGGLVLYVLAGFGCVTATSAVTLVAWRLVQGMGAACGTVMAFAIVRDLFEGAAARTKLSYVSVVLGVAPVVAPTVGGGILLLAGWRGIYGLLALGGLPLLAAVAWSLDESRRPGPRHAGVLQSYLALLGHRRALSFALTNAFSFGCMFAWISGSSMVLMGELRVSTQVYGLLFACTAGAIMLGSWFNGWMAGRGPVRRLMLFAVWAQFAAALLLVVAVAARPLSLATLMPLLALTTFCRGIIGPNATHGTMEPLPRLAGVAAAVLGFAQMAVGAVASAVVALLFPSLGALAMVATMLVMAALCLVMGRSASRGYDG